MWTLTKPTVDQIAGFLNEQRQMSLTFVPGTVAGFNVDEERVLLGRGEAVFLAACQALREWRMFPPGWTEIFPAGAALVIDQDVAVLARIFRLWWLNACRIISVTDETNPLRRFGFTYATLPGHVEMGEELFLVERDADDRVWYQIRAVSRPRYWLVKLAYPLARWLQRRFRGDSMRAMQVAVRDR
ncbi:MAG: hypothetical protein JWN70_1811 [Planctomycetaceae bacterium]|nr:hypothetical protein [Planctomycetaceae bacterium]